MFYYVCGIIIGLLLIINGFIKFKENKILFLMSIFCGLGLSSSGVLGFIFEDLEFIFIILLVAFSLIYIVYSLIAFKKKKK